jgi:hypothetical protein
VRYRSDDDMSDDEMFIKRTLRLMGSHQNCLYATVLLSCKYYDKNDASPVQSGFGWTMEKLQNSGEGYRMFRMDASLFYMLHHLLVSDYGLESSIHIDSIESLAIFLLSCGQCNILEICLFSLV